jgi:4-amino-4-deoxy-L-arabinose transferase-like glycosyltransferase
LIEKPNCRVNGPEWLAVLASCAAASLAAVVWSWRNGAMLNYGDAVAHLHIARRVLDARLPRLSELGSVWLPLPHLLLLPFVQVYSWWASGWAGVIPSALAYMAACAGVYRLARHWLRPAPSALALAFFALNPNLLYLQTTAMTEPLFLCEMVWVVVWLVKWRTSLDADQGKAHRLLWLIAVVLAAAVFTRYDGWVMALVVWACMGLVLLRRGRLRSWSFWLASMLVVAAPVTWFVYNAVSFGDWLYFARGPYSANAIEIRTASHGAGPPHPGWHNPWVAELFFIKVAEMDAVAAAWGNVLLAVSFLGMVWAWLTARRRGLAWALLLWFPVPFYAYSVAYGAVPIFLPPWWPHSWYNTRYGMEMLPAFALGLGFAAQFALAAVNEFKPREFDPRWVRTAAGALFAVLVLNAAQMVRERPLVYVEGTKNLASRRDFEKEIPPALRALLAERPGATVLMGTSVYPTLVALTGIPFRQTINESDLWIYHDALAAPAAHAAIVLAFDGDEIDQAVKAHPEGLTAVRRFTQAGQAPGTLYVSGTPAAGQAPPASPAQVER